MDHKKYRRAMEDAIVEARSLSKFENSDKISGGLADKKKKSDFNSKKLKEGTKIELEHTKDSEIASEIASDHLAEDSKYYDKLKVMENKDLKKAPVRSPRKGHTIGQLENLKEMNWHNPDTGSQISEEEGEDYLMRLRQKKADRQVKELIKPKKPRPSADKPEDWFGSSEKMKKGVARRLFPFDPQKVPQTERADVNEWQTYGNEPAPATDYYREPGTVREELDPISPQAKQRALLKLGSNTKVRKSPTTGEREFLLHRGVLAHEHEYVTDDNHYSYETQRSSWTPRYDKAKSFTKPEGHSHNENFEHTEEESLPGKVISAWIPESKIVHAPYMYGGVSRPSSRGENDYRKEHEIIVAPHKGKMVPHEEAFPAQSETRSDKIFKLSHQAKRRAERKQELEEKMKQPLGPKLTKKPKKSNPDQLEFPLAASELAKAPIENLDPSIGREAPETPMRERYEMSGGTAQIGDGIFHHYLFSPRNEEGLHMLTNSSDPFDKKATVYSHILGDTPRLTGKTLTVQLSQVHPEHKGKGYGKKLYELALKRHGTLESDELVSPQASAAYEHLQSKGAKVSFGKPDTRERHVAKLAASELQKSKNVREQRKKVFGTDPNAARISDRRMKMMQRIKDYAEKKYGLPLVTASGKRDASGKLKEEKGIEKQPFDVFSPEGHLAEKQRQAKVKELGLKRLDPKPDWRSGQLETQPSPDAAVHELAHLDLAPESMTAPEFQNLMDRRWGESQKLYGHMQQKRTQGEVQPMSIENPIRRELGLPANKQTKPVTQNEPVLDDPGQQRFYEAKDPKTGEKVFLDRQSRLQNPETVERRQQISEGSLKFDPKKGWYKASDFNALANLRARGQKEEATRRLKERFQSKKASSPKKIKDFPEKDNKQSEKLAASEKMQKMSRPRLSFSKLNIGNEEHNVKNVGTLNQKKLTVNEIVNEFFPNESSEVPAKSAFTTQVSKLIVPSKQYGANIVANSPETSRSKGKKQVTYAFTGKYSPNKKDPKTLENKIQAGRSLDTVRTHEAQHRVMNRISQLYGEETKNKVLSHLMEHAFSDPKHLSIMNMYAKHRGYSPKSKGFHEEVVNCIRDVLTDKKTRDHFGNFLEKKLGYESNPSEEGDKHREHLSALKNGWNKLTQKANTITHNDVLRIKEGK